MPTSTRPSSRAATGEGSGTNYRAVVRLRDGATWQQADAELSRAWADHIARMDQHNPGTRVRILLRAAAERADRRTPPQGPGPHGRRRVHPADRLRQSRRPGRGAHGAPHAPRWPRGWRSAPPTGRSRSSSGSRACCWESRAERRASASGFAALRGLLSLLPKNYPAGRHRAARLARAGLHARACRC